MGKKWIIVLAMCLVSFCVYFWVKVVVDRREKLIAKIRASNFFSDYTPSSEGMTIIRSDEGLYGFRNDSTNQIVVPCQYYYVHSFSSGVAVVAKNQKMGLIDKKGQFVVPMIYSFDVPMPVWKNLTVVRLKGKEGVIDNTGKIVIPIIYNIIYGMADGILYVSNNDVSYYIDTEGNYLTSHRNVHPQED